MQTKEEIAYEVKDQLTKSMSNFGFMIIQTLVTDIEPDQRVRAAMNEINAASRLRYILCYFCLVLHGRLYANIVRACVRRLLSQLPTGRTGHFVAISAALQPCLLAESMGHGGQCCLGASSDT